MIAPFTIKIAFHIEGYRSVDAALMDTTSVEFLSFDMLPTSHLFMPGHRMQVRLAGVDVDNFKMVYTEMGTWEIFHNAQYPSHVELPIMDRRKDVGDENSALTIIST
jgi:hypothetical protein